MQEQNLSHYKEIGFKCGIEIHQRLNTNNKLFCNCSTDSENDTIVGTVERMQRAVSGELGKMDLSSKFEQNKKRIFKYNIFKNSSCLVDIDEEPPHPLNIDALIISLGIAKEMNMQLVDEVHIMRKEVVDGSDPSAFQRTAIIGFDGSILVNNERILIESISLEEESSAIVKSSTDAVIYNIDRLGIPLIEIGTFANIPTPKMARDTALYIGNMLRSTGRMKRGIGTIRQDVNISIKNGARIEIKGLQDIDNMHNFIDNEIKRQMALIEIKSKLIDMNGKVGKPIDVTHIFENTSASIISNSIKNNGVVVAFALYGFEGVLGIELGSNRRFGSEISDYAKMGGTKGLIHSDEKLDKYNFSKSEIDKLKELLKIKKNDAFIIITEAKDTALNAAELAIWRANYAMHGVPEETRAAINDERFITVFIRPLPGGSRMYPETDIEPINITDKIIESAERAMPKMEDALKRLEQELSDKELAKQMLLSPRYALYKKIRENNYDNLKFAANILLQKFKELERNNVDVNSIEDESIIEMFLELSNKHITKQAIDLILKISASNSDKKISDIIKEHSYERISGKKLHEIIAKFIANNPNANKELLKKMIMSKYRINIDGEELNSALNNF